MTLAPQRRPAAAVLLTLAVIALSVLSPTTAPAANAHDSVLLTVPADGEHLDLAPAEIAITFTDDILELGAVVMVVDGEAKNWADGDMRLDGAQATQPVAADLPDGAYDVRWRVVSADGHPVSGTFAFTVGAAAEPGPQATAGTNATDAPSPDGDGASADSEENADADGTGLPLVVVGLIGALGGLAVFALFTVWRARRRRNASST